MTSRLFLITVLSLALGCEGALDISSERPEVSLDTIDDSNAGASAGGGHTGGGAERGPGVTGDVTPGGSGPSMVQEPPAVLEYATHGSRCTAATRGDFLILSDVALDCAAGAAAIDADPAMDLAGVVVVPLTGEPTLNVDARYCPQGGACTTVAMQVTLDEQGESVRGTWRGVIDGVERNVAFAAEPCDYDDVLTPALVDTPAAGISVAEVAVYQGVKVPIAEDGEALFDRNAPIVAGRPGVVRVFVEPQPDWVERDVRVRLTLGELVLEETFRPTAASIETEGDSTVNFALSAGDLGANVEYSVEILESASCVDVEGELASPRVPEVGTAELGSEALAGDFRVVLVPIQYDADGSGRVPPTSSDAVERFRTELFTHYPIPDVELTVRDPVATQIGLSPNGAGFGEMLNFCLSIRANDDPDPDVYYYCMIQPAGSAQSFCGGGCVAGVAPLANAGDAQARGGIGIAFPGSGEETFVHELGHALGRPHSPCGGAAGTDPDYPYAQGLIGSWGYDIMSGQLFEPTARADFMGYCNPTWVSDYTYGELYERLESVLGTQSVMLNTAPRRWRTAVVERGGAVSWGPDVVLDHLPTGGLVPATLRDLEGDAMGAPQVYVTPVADIDAVLITVEDVGFSGAVIDVPGLGELVVE